MSKSKKYDIELSKINRKSYNYYEEIQDYEYSYVIAEQMLFRTKSFKDLFQTKIEDRKEKWIEKATELGLDTYNVNINFTLNDEPSLLYQDPHSYTINDFGEGEEALFSLIDYYYRKNKIYVINFKKNILYTDFLEEVDFEEVYKNFDNYFIPCKDLISRYENIIIKPISKKLFLRELEDSFLDTLTLKDIIGFNGVINQYWNKEPLICDLGEDALSNLIAFYNEDSRIYRAIKNIKTKKIDYQRINNPNNIHILFNHHDFFIPCKVKKNNKIVIEYKVLSDKIPLFEIDESNKKLDKKFSANIKLSEIEYLENDVSSALSISSIKSGLNKLINYYIEKKKIFPLELSKRTKNKFKHCNIKRYYKNEISPIQKFMNKYRKFTYESKIEISPKKKSMNNYRKLINEYKNNRVLLIKKIMNNPDRYYIPLINSLNKKRTILTQINKNIPLKILDKNFYNELDSSNITKKNIKIKPAIRSMLKFDKSTIIELPINIKLPEEELVAYIKKIKKDYEEKNTNLEHPLEIMGKELFQANKPSKSSEIEVANRNLMKKNIADAFYIYDVEKYFLDKKEELEKKKNDEISKLNDYNSHYSLIEDITEKYNNDIDKYSNEIFLKYIKSINKKFTSNKIDVARRYMKYYINKEKYYEIITGIHSIQH